MSVRQYARIVAYTSIDLLIDLVTTAYISQTIESRRARFIRLYVDTSSIIVHRIHRDIPSRLSYVHVQCKRGEKNNRILFFMCRC